MSDLRSYYIQMTEKYIRKAEELYGRTFNMPLIDDSLRGHCGGQAYSHQWKLRFNNDIARRYKDDPNDPYENTIGHEVAHLITFALHGRVQSHGSQWKRVMMQFGLRPDRCHTYETKPAKVKSKFVYKCSCQEHLIGPVRHKKMRAGISKYRCNRCRTTLEFIRAAGQVTHEQFRAGEEKPKAPKAPRKVAAKRKVRRSTSGPTKLQQAVELMKKHPGWTRGSYIDCFMQVLGMSKAGASTYYYNAKKALEG